MPYSWSSIANSIDPSLLLVGIPIIPNFDTLSRIIITQKEVIIVDRREQLHILMQHCVQMWVRVNIVVSEAYLFRYS